MALLMEEVDLASFVLAFMILSSATLQSFILKSVDQEFRNLALATLTLFTQA